jgi:hypothetical protein
MAAGYIQIHFWFQRGINYNRLFLRANEIRQTSFANSADLDNLSLAAWQWNICCVPRQAPGTHTSLKRASIYASRLQLFRGGFASMTSIADSHDWNISWQRYSIQSMRIMRF